MEITKVKRYLPVVIGVVFLGIFTGYRIADVVGENRARAAKLEAGNQTAVDVRMAQKKTLYPALSFSAGLEPDWSAELSAKVDGRIESVRVNEGDLVAAGITAAVLTDGDLAGQVMQAKGNLMAARSNLEQAELDYRRYLSLAADGAVAGQVLDNARTKRDAAHGQVQTSEGALALVERKAADLQIVVPRTGVITKRHLQEGAFVRSGSPIVTVADTTKLVAKATIGESQVANLAVGAKVDVWVEALGESFVGTVTTISPVAQLPSRTFGADISIDNAEGRLKAGMFAAVKIPAAAPQEALAVPESAIVMRGDQPSLYVLNDDQTVAQRVVRTGVTGDGWIEIKEGLNEGERFVSGGQNKLRDGMTVKLVQKDEAL